MGVSDLRGQNLIIEYGVRRDFERAQSTSDFVAAIEGAMAQFFSDLLEHHGIDRRRFLQFCGGVAASLALPRTAAGEIAGALEKTRRPVLLWLEFQDCAGDTEALLRASRPSVAEILLDVLSLDYHETLMAAAGQQAEAARNAALGEGSGYLVAIEGSIPVGADGAYCCVGGRSAIDIAREVCSEAAATIAVGSCAAYGGLPAAAPNPTDARSVAETLPDLNTLVNLPGCPLNVDNLVALLMHFIAYKTLPAVDRYRRPLFAYGKVVHDHCERRGHFNSGQFVEAWGDEGHRHGYCLYKMGCKGPVTRHNCPAIRYNDGTNWPVGAGHPCAGCSESRFWDTMSPFYSHVAGLPGLGANVDIDRAGMLATAATGAVFALHGVTRFGKNMLIDSHEDESQRASHDPGRNGKKSNAGNGSNLEDEA